VRTKNEEKMKCPVCDEEAKHYEDKDVEQWYCEPCGWWVNV